MTYEQGRALMEGHRNGASEEYFRAREKAGIKVTAEREPTMMPMPEHGLNVRNPPPQAGGVDWESSSALLGYISKLMNDVHCERPKDGYTPEQEAELSALRRVAKRIGDDRYTLAAHPIEQPSNIIPQGLTPEEIRQYIIQSTEQPSQDAKDAAKWREHVGKLDALVAFCPTCCEGKVASADMTRDEVIFQCGRTSGKSEAARAAQAQTKVKQT